MLNKSKRSNARNSENYSAEEIARFDKLAESCWDPESEYMTALEFNRARTVTMLHEICHHFGRSHDKDNAFHDLNILDVGCGGGLICEAMATEGAQVTGIDASSISIEVATRHAGQQGLTIDYKHCLVEELGNEQKFDVVINAEVVEHVPDQPAMIKDCARLVKPGGMLILATINRTFTSYLVAIIGAEYVMGYLPKGTHSWRKFVKPRQLDKWVGRDFYKTFKCGMTMNPLNKKWRRSKGMRVNYMQCYHYSEK